MTKPVRITLSRAKGWRMPPNTVKVDRSTRWGNPVVVGKPWEGEVVEDITHAVTIFRDGVNCGCEPFPQAADIQTHLMGKNLACWCKQGTLCHADILLELANA
ncbi:MAG: DUF4326 domain-containing protein [Burkholderiaceae bacterium]|nr:DUF4326 domain-containing protein [Burkholderiaceae bacterium]MDP3135617.1 DUF4326 domain-containing protein [Burkholderiaceae bacterium]